ncbi:MAG: hypothetical protein AMXMBFR47_07230 [Planctomycetota bacterium]
MTLALLWILMQTQPASTQPTLPDPYAVPKAERMEWYRRVVDRGKGLNGYDDYARAVKAYVRTYDFEHEEAIGKETAAWLILNERIIPIRLDWPAEHEAGIKVWLRLNADALRATRKAAAAARCFPTDALRSPLDFESKPGDFSATSFRLLAHLHMADAGEKARNGRWAEAYRDWAIVYRIAAHGAWSATLMGSNVQKMIERVAFDQFVTLAAATPPRDIAGLRRAVNDAWALHTPSEEILVFVDRLFFAEMIDRDHAWARDELKDPKHRETLEGVRGLGDNLKDLPAELRIGPSAFKSVDEYKSALLKGSPQETRRVAKEKIARESAWWELPLPAAIPKIGEMRADVKKIADGDPYLRFWTASNLMPPGRTRFFEASAQLYRRGLLTLFALLEWKAKHREWPATLDVLNLGDDAVDPFSVKPFVYRRSDDKKDFVLYSVGVNLTDDGGTEPSKETVIEDADGDIVLWPRKAPEYVAP